mmetsp:Transcript_16152/g.38195  ORF Transcript_16152/g.38195 Transcript_16152/m.38195 type:complete len:503 (-) Transcript_16152:39-1547(-)
MLVNLVLRKVGRGQHQHGAVVPSSAAVVAGAEDGDAAAVVLLRVAAAILWHLVAPHDEPQPILHAELHGHVGPELDADAPLGLELPVGRRGVAPEEVREDLVLDGGGHGVRRRALRVVQGVDVVYGQGLDPCEAAMDDKDLLLHNGAEREDLEGADEAAVRNGPVLGEDLVAEASAAVAVERVHVLVLVVAAVDDEALGVGEEEGEEEHEDLGCLASSVSNVAVDEIPVLCRRGSELVQDVQYVRELPVRVADYDQPAVLRRVGLDHRLRVLCPVSVRELCGEVVDVLPVQRLRLPVHQVVVHQSLRALEGHWNRQPEARVAVPHVHVHGLAAPVLLLRYLLDLVPLPRPRGLLLLLGSVLVCRLQVRRHRVARGRLVDEAGLVGGLALEEPGEGLCRRGGHVLGGPATADPFEELPPVHAAGGVRVCLAEEARDLLGGEAAQALHELEELLGLDLAVTIGVKLLECIPQGLLLRCRVCRIAVRHRAALLRGSRLQLVAGPS